MTSDSFLIRLGTMASPAVHGALCYFASFCVRQKVSCSIVPLRALDLDDVIAWNSDGVLATAAGTRIREAVVGEDQSVTSRFKLTLDILIACVLSCMERIRSPDVTNL